MVLDSLNPAAIAAQAALSPFFAFATELLRLVNTIVEGQTTEQKAKLWQWYVDDMARWRKFWGLEA